MPNDKLNFSPSKIWAIVIAGAATALCAAIDLILQEDNYDNTDYRTK